MDEIRNVTSVKHYKRHKTRNVTSVTHYRSDKTINVTSVKHYRCDKTRNVTSVEALEKAINKECHVCKALQKRQYKECHFCKAICRVNRDGLKLCMDDALSPLSTLIETSVPFFSSVHLPDHNMTHFAFSTLLSNFLVFEEPELLTGLGNLS